MENKKGIKYKILFVCLGNICRSPSAEAVMKSVVKKAGLEESIYIDSAGIIGMHSGNSADSRMISHAIKRGYDLTSKSRQVNPKRDYNDFDIIIGMDNQNITDLMSLAPHDDAIRSKIVKMTDFCNKMEMDVVPDPYYGGDSGFELVLDLLEDACDGLLKDIKCKISI